MSDKTAEVLTESETTALAHCLIGRLRAEDWLEWEDVPYLSERGFERLCERVDVILKDHYRAASLEVDAAEVLERVSWRALVPVVKP